MPLIWASTWHNRSPPSKLHSAAPDDGRGPRLALLRAADRSFTRRYKVLSLSRLEDPQ